jgi:hypothetical protein
MGRSSPSPTRLSSPNVFRIDVSGGRFAAFRASIGAGRVDADNGRQVDHPPTTRCPNWLVHAAEQRRDQVQGSVNLGFATSKDVRVEVWIAHPDDRVAAHGRRQR